MHKDATAAGEAKRGAAKLAIVSFILASTALLATGCNYKQKFDAGPTNYGTRASIDQNADDKYKSFNASSLSDTHNNTSLMYDRVLSNRIGKMPGISTAIIMTSGSNAYAAVILDKSATGTQARGNIHETDNRGGTKGMYDASTGSPYADPRHIVTGKSSMFTVRDPYDLSTVFKRKVSAMIRLSNPELQNVFISANRDFINESNFYKLQSLKGVNLQQYVPSFNTMAKKYFPPRDAVRGSSP